MPDRRSALRFILASLLWIAIQVAAAGLVDASSPGERRPTAPSRREAPDDPPGEPARPVAGATAAAPVTFGPFTSVQANVDGGGANIPGDAANEPSIAVNPTRPNSMAIGWRQFDTVSSNFRQGGWAYTDDGGRTWTFPGVLEPGVFRSDPVLSFDAAGDFYYASLQGDFSVDIFRSTDDGASWLSPVPAWGGDKQWLEIDRTGGIGGGNLYMAWSTAGGCCGNNTFTRSTDGGQTFQTPSHIPSEPVWGTLDVSPDGILFVAGVDIINRDSFFVAQSVDAQFPGGTPSFFTANVDLGGSLVAFGGNSSPNPSGLLGQVWIGVDRSGGPSSGYVYVVCSVDPPGPDPMDVHFVRSTNNGSSWSAPVRINDDVGDNWQWFGTMDVAPNGRIDVVWNDSRNTGAANLSELHYAFSTDGGVTWSANQQLSPAWNSHIGWPNQQKIGDYYDMVSDLVGAHLAWAATFNGEQDVYYLRINDYDCNGNGIPDAIDIASGSSPDTNGNGIPDECEGATSAVAISAPGPGTVRLAQNVPNPFNPTTTIRFDLPAAGARVRLEIIHPTGRRVRTLVDGYLRGGARAVRWDGTDGLGRSMPSGTYVYRLEVGGQVVSRKLVLAR